MLSNEEIIEAIRRGDPEKAMRMLARKTESVDLGCRVAQFCDRHTLVGWWTVYKHPILGTILRARACRRVHYWGTDKGLCQLKEGPREGTQMQPVYEGHEFPWNAVIFTLPVEDPYEWGVDDVPDTGA